MKNVIVFGAVLVIMSVPALAYHPTKTNCSDCHLVHNSQTGSDVPLWSGKTIDPAPDFVKYFSDTLDAVPGEPVGSTLLCLACHDQSGGHYPSMNAVTGDLSKTHPIEIIYNSTLVVNYDDELKDPSVATVERSDGIGGTIAEELLGGGDTIKCISCHDVHIQGLHGDANPDLPSPPVDNDYDIPHLQDIDGIEYTARGDDPAFEDFSLKYGALCVTCHIK